LRHCTDSDILIASLFSLFKGNKLLYLKMPLNLFLSVPGFFANVGLAEAHFPLSAARLPRVATAIAKITDF
jgi:hypothetical protein